MAAAHSLDLTGSATTTTSKPTSACSATTYAGADAEFEFTLTAPTWVDFAMSRKGPMYTEVYLYLNGSDPYIDVYGRGIDGKANGTYLLEPGEYRGYLEGEVRTSGNTTSALRKGSASVSVKFASAGSASAKATYLACSA